MAGNHDLGTAWTKYKDRAYGECPVNMTQTCWDVEGTFVDKGIKCEATFKGKVEKNILSGTWSSANHVRDKIRIRPEVLPDHGRRQQVMAWRFLF